MLSIVAGTQRTVGGLALSCSLIICRKCVCVHVLSLIQLLATCQASLPVGLSSQKYGNGLPFPSPGDLPDPGIKPMSPALAVEFFTTNAIWEDHR